MHGRAGELDAVGQRRFMDAKSIEALAAEGGDQSGVDVHNGVGVGLHQLFGEDDHAACQNHQCGVQRLHFFHQRQGHGAVGVEVFPGQHVAGNPRLSRPLQGVSALLGGDHGGNFSAAQLAPLLSIDQRLQIGAAAGDQNCDFGRHSRITFSPSFLMMVPMT